MIMSYFCGRMKEYQIDISTGLVDMFGQINSDTQTLLCDDIVYHYLLDDHGKKVAQEIYDDLSINPDRIMFLPHIHVTHEYETYFNIEVQLFFRNESKRLGGYGGVNMFNNIPRGSLISYMQQFINKHRDRSNIMNLKSELKTVHMFLAEVYYSVLKSRNIKV